MDRRTCSAVAWFNKGNKMKWLRRKLRNWVLSDDTQNIMEKSICISNRESDCVEGEPVLNFKVFSAVGGRVVEFRTYDRQKDRNFTKTYIITNEQDFGERIAKIATMESLKV
jgi:hypothetical protein